MSEKGERIDYWHEDEIIDKLPMRRDLVEMALAGFTRRGSLNSSAWQRGTSGRCHSSGGTSCNWSRPCRQTRTACYLMACSARSASSSLRVEVVHESLPWADSAR
jgi:hypothetical protein